MYINKESNHPPSVIKQIPNMVQTRLTCISKTEDIFNESVHEYEKALSLSGYKSTLKFDKNKKSNVKN